MAAHDEYDYWLDAATNLFRSPSQDGQWPPPELCAHGFPVSWEFVCFAWDMRERVLALWSVMSDQREPVDAWATLEDRLTGRAPSPPAAREHAENGAKLIGCPTRVSDRSGGQIYVVSPKTKMEAVIPFTRYEALGDLLEKIQTEFAVATRASHARKPWAVIEYTADELRVVAAAATQTRKARYA